MPVILQAEPDRALTPAERERIDRFVASFVAKKGDSPLGTWRVPGVGYVVFLPN